MKKSKMPFFLSFLFKTNKIVPEPKVSIPIEYLEAIREREYCINKNRVVPFPLYTRR